MGEFVPNFERRLENKPLGPKPIPTAGAIPVKNDKGQITMKKVKVQRYMAGKVPEFARDKYDSDEQDEDDVKKTINDRGRFESYPASGLRGYSKTEASSSKREHVSTSESEDEATIEERRRRVLIRKEKLEKEEAPFEREDLEEEDDEDEIQKRRELLKMQRRRQDEEEHFIKQLEAEDVSEEGEEEESEEETESEDEELVPRLKPIFVRRTDRITLIEIEKEKEKLEKLRLEDERKKEERKRQSARLVEDTLKRENELEKARKDDHIDLTSVNTDDENEEIAYELWRVREMRRLKRNREEREAMAKEKEELEKIHNMTEEERRNYLRFNPRVVTNKQDKGKYKFLQKYYHRGVFFLDKEDDVLRRNFAEATGEDVFDKSVLPKVMQVKNFGKASRSKWTHLTAEDTTDHQGVWATPTPLSVKFLAKHAAGFKNSFEKPSIKKRKTTD